MCTASTCPHLWPLKHNSLFPGTPSPTHGAMAVIGIAREAGDDGRNRVMKRLRLSAPRRGSMTKDETLEVLLWVAMSTRRTSLVNKDVEHTILHIT